MTEPATVPPGSNPGNRNNLAVVLLLLLAGALIAAGTLLGENILVERNAHYLCLDCLGIG